MASVPCSGINNSILCRSRAISSVGLSSFPLSEPKAGAFHYSTRDRSISQTILPKRTSPFLRRGLYSLVTKKVSTIPRSNISSNSSGSGDGSSNQDKTTPFGYTRKDVLLIGVGVTLLGVGLKSGLEFFGVDPLQAGNVVQLVLVLGLTVGWISTYIFRVSNKEMTYAQQLRDYESKVMEVCHLALTLRWWRLCRDDFDCQPSSLGEYLEVERRFGDGAFLGGAAAELERVGGVHMQPTNRRILFADGRVLPPSEVDEAEPPAGSLCIFSAVSLSGICNGGGGSGVG